MHYITEVSYESGYRLRIRFEDGLLRQVDLTDHLAGEMFEPLRDMARFRTARLNSDIDTVTWANGADMSPDFLHEISVPVDTSAVGKVAEKRGEYMRK